MSASGNEQQKRRLSSTGLLDLADIIWNGVVKVKHQNPDA
jgi:hypothetical protein